MSGASHVKRLVTAAVLLLLLLAVAGIGGLAVRLTLFAISVCGLWEFYSFFWPNKKNLPLKMAAILAAGFLLLIPQPVFEAYLHISLVLIFCVFGLFFLLQYSLTGERAEGTDFTVALAGLLYIPLVLRFFVGFLPQEVLLVLACAICGDTAAYYLGTWFGKQRIWPVISPKKTWLGSFAGLAASVLAALIIGVIWGEVLWWRFMVLGALLGVAAQLGDFFVSAVKRRCKIKDSGSLLPGHGGILDRIDSLLFLVPVYALFARLMPFF
ncbi:MAG: phosphatidate cytidylyltransferase [Desulfonatronovibrionaceae bacterium]